MELAWAKKGVGSWINLMIGIANWIWQQFSALLLLPHFGHFPDLEAE